MWNVPLGSGGVLVGEKVKLEIDGELDADKAPEAEAEFPPARRLGNRVRNPRGLLTMAEQIRFYFDPLCPWCYQTSRWARRLDELGVVEVEWRVFSLAIVNRGDEGRSDPDMWSGPALRTAIAVREAHGNDAVGAFYKAVSDARASARRAC